jgi:hypothetical protein
MDMPSICCYYGLTIRTACPCNKRRDKPRFDLTMKNPLLKQRAQQPFAPCAGHTTSSGWANEPRSLYHNAI